MSFEFALLHCRQAVPDVFGIEMRVALDQHPPHPRLYHAELHHAACDVLLGQHDLRNAVTAFAEGLFQHLQRALDIGEVLVLADVRRDQLLHFRLGER